MLQTGPQGYDGRIKAVVTRWLSSDVTRMAATDDVTVLGASSPTTDPGSLPPENAKQFRGLVKNESCKTKISYLISTIWTLNMSGVNPGLEAPRWENKFNVEKSNFCT